MSKETKKETVDEALSAVEKAHGKSAVYGGPAGYQFEDVKRISTGSHVLDDVLGGGLPVGRLAELFGPDDKAKDALVGLLCRTTMSGGKIVALVSMDPIDPSVLRDFGVDTERLLMSNPESGDKALSIVEMLARSGVVDLIIIRGKLDPIEIANGTVSADADEAAGLTARMFSEALRRLTAVVYKSDATILFVPGGDDPSQAAVKFYSSVRVDVRYDTSPASNSLGYFAATARVVKNKHGVPFKGASLAHSSQGFDQSFDLLEYALRVGVLAQKESGLGRRYVTFNGEQFYWVEGHMPLHGLCLAALRQPSTGLYDKLRELVDDFLASKREQA